MSKIELVRQEMIKAMKAESAAQEALSMLLAALKKKAIDMRSDLEEEENAVNQGDHEAQERRLGARVPDIIEETGLRSACTEFAPKLMNEDEVRAEIKAVWRSSASKNRRPKTRATS